VKRNVRSIIVVLIIAVMIILGSVLTIRLMKKSNITNAKPIKKEIKENKGLSNEEIQDGMDELKSVLNDTTNKVVLIVNEKQISEKEIAFMDFQLNNN